MNWKRNSRVNPIPVKFGLYLESLSSAKHLTERNIRLKFNKIPYS